jgi:hypothetical protein
MMVAAAPRIPLDVTQTSVASFLAEHLELRDGLYLWQHGFDPMEVRASIEQRWGLRAWDRIRRQAWRIAAA